jgi:threonine dehydrogenase-like Zn-dependent dehydrogenase
MKAIGLDANQPGTARLVDLPEPALDEIPEGQGVLVQVLQVGVDGTDRELYLEAYGNPPPGYNVLVPGHESLGRILEVGPDVTDLAPGDYVVATVRRPGESIYDQIGMSDMSTDETHRERGINRLHGFLTERYVEHADYLVRVPTRLGEVAVLLEPMSIAEKGIIQAYEIQRRLRLWSPEKAAVMGAGAIGLLATLILRCRGLDVTTFARTPPPNQKADLVAALGARYLSTREISVAEASVQYGPWDLILEATGYSPLVIESAHALANNGVLVLASVTSGERTMEVEIDRLNQEFMTGNKVMVGTVNAHRGYFERGIADFAQAQVIWPGWLARMLTHPVHGLENYEALFDTLCNAEGAIKVYMVIQEDAT